ncbi:zinc carboxypeptidase-like [Sergentomyia squamirostris]
MKIRVFFIVIFVILNRVSAEPYRFDNHRIYRLRIERDDQLKILRNLRTGPSSYEFFDEPHKVGQDMDIVVPPSLQSEFESILKDKEFAAKLMVNNFQELLDRERRQSDDGEFGWESYHNVDEIHQWLYSIEERYPEVTIIKAGTTYEGRDILGVNINRNPGQNPGIFIESQIHAREWITSATATWIINKFLTATDEQPDIKFLADNINWYIFPVINADGYEYSRNHYRLWRKTRSKQGLICNGVDPNRNWDVFWEKGGIGSSANMCEINFAGPTAFSEVETKALSEYILSIRDNLNFYLAFHCARNMLLFPWGHTANPNVNYFQYTDIASATVRALRERHGTEYTYGSIYSTIYPATGSSADWVQYALNIPGFTYEFRYFNTATGEIYDYVTPPEEILPNAEEVLDSLIVLVEKATEHGYINISAPSGRGNKQK